MLGTVVGSIAIHGAALLAYVLMQPPPPFALALTLDGPGRGSVTAAPTGRTCRSKRCAMRFSPGTEIELTAAPGPDSTFLGWSGDCTPDPDNILRCTLRLDGDLSATVGFGKMPKQVEVAWMNLDEIPPEEETLTVRLPEPEIEAELLVEPLAELLPDLELPPPPPPEPVPPPPPPPETAPTPPPPPEMANLRSVEVPDENEVEDAPDDATHLSDKNRDVAEETRAEDTNLERAQAGAERFSEASAVDSEDIGAEEDVIAELEDTEATTLDDVTHDDSPRSGDDQRAVGAVVGEAGDDGEEGEAGDGRDSADPGMLAMRGISGRGPLVTDDSDPGRGGDEGRAGKRGKSGIKTDLAFDDYERIVGADKVEEELAMGRKRMSKKRGRWERKMDVMRSALENFTPEVRTGNQTALKTRAAPFAVFIARMHRKIHPLWAFGFLEDMNDKAANHPMNNWELRTKLEIVINGDGTVHKVNILHHSGLLEFDVAAIDVVMTAAPYQAPPKKILSPDGRAYMHWGFYRNYRQCGTFNAQPFILSEAPEESDGGMDDSDLVARVPRKARMKALEEAARRAPPTTSGRSGPASPDDPEAIHAANLWITGFTKANIARMLQVSQTPFRSGGSFQAQNSADVRAVYQTVIHETKGRMNDWRLMTPAGYRKRFGSLPAGVSGGKTELLLVVQSGSERFVLSMLRTAEGGYKFDGLFR